MGWHMRALWILLATLLALAAPVLPAAADRRVALIVGNSAYEHADKLANPVTDSRNLRDALQKLGFGEKDIVYGENLNKREFERAIGRFAVLARDADVALAYYAGHGATFGDTPYIVPVDARFDSIDQMAYELVPLESMIGELRKAKGVRIAIVDACRDNGAEKDLKRTEARGGEISRGLAPPRNPDGLILAYATQYLSTAADGPEGGDSPFTAALLKHLPTPGLDVKDLFFKVAQEVLATTKGRQRPEVKVSFFDEYALVKVNVVVQPSPPVAPIAPLPAFNVQQAEFDVALRADTPATLAAFLAKYPAGPLAEIAQRELDRQARLATLPLPQPVTALAPPPVANMEPAEFDAAMRADVPAALEDFLARHPAGALAEIARRERDRLTRLAAVPLPVAALVPPVVKIDQLKFEVALRADPVAALGALLASRIGGAWPEIAQPVQHQIAKLVELPPQPGPAPVPQPLPTAGRAYILPAGASLVPQAGHSADIMSVAFSPDGRTLLSGSRDNTLKLWDAARGTLLRSIEGHKNGVATVVFSPDGRTVLSGGIGALSLWDRASGKRLRSFDDNGYVKSVAFSPDGRTLLSGQSDKTVKLWDVASGKLLRSFEGHAGGVQSVAFSPDGRSMLSGSEDKTLKLWDVAGGKLLRSLEGHAEAVNSVAFSPDGRSVLSGSKDKSLKLWDAASGKLLRSFEGHKNEVLSVAFAPDGRTVLSGGWDNSLILWDAASGRKLRTFAGHGERVTSVAFSPDGRKLLSGSSDRTLKLWDAASGAPLLTIEGTGFNVDSVAFSPDGRSVLSGTEDSGLKLWGAASGKVLGSFSGHTSHVTAVAFARDGRSVLSGSYDDTLKLWDAASGKLMQSFAAGEVVVAVAFSPDGRTVLSGGWSKTLKLWDAATGKLLRSFEGHTDNINSVAFSPDGRTVLSGSGDYGVKLWDAASGKLLFTLQGHANAVESVAFSPDGRIALSAGYDDIVNLWDAASGKLLRSLKGKDGAIYSAAFSSDGTKIVTGNQYRTVSLWDAASGALLHRLEGHFQEVNAVAFSPNGRAVLSGSKDATLKLWAASSGALLASFLTIGEHAVAFTPEGLFVTDADPRQVFAIVRGSEILPLDDFIAANRRETLFDEGFKAAGAK